MSYTKDLQDKLVQYETIAEVENERTPMEEAFDHLDETIRSETEHMRKMGLWTSEEAHPKEDMWKSLIESVETHARTDKERLGLLMHEAMHYTFSRVRSKCTSTYSKPGKWVDEREENIAHWTTHRTPNQAPMARRVPRRGS